MPEAASSAVGGATEAPAPPIYRLLAPLVRGKTIVDVGADDAGPHAVLTAAGGKEVRAVAATLPRLPAPDGAADVVLCLLRLGELSSDVERHRLITELRRVLRRGGYCVLRVRAAGEGALAPGAAASGTPPGFSARAFADLVEHHFATVQLLAEAPLSGVGFFVTQGSSSPDESAGRTELPATHHVAFCTEARKAPWELPPSVLFPDVGVGGGPTPGRTGGGAREEQAGDVDPEAPGAGGGAATGSESPAERDRWREAMMSLQDELDRREQILASLRREVDRYLRQMSDYAAGSELAAIECDRLQRRAEAAESALEAVRASLKRRDAAYAELEAELQRLRAPARGKEPRLARVRREP